MIGTRLSHYEIVAKLGEGGMGVVYKARDPRLDRLVAIKLLGSGVTADEGYRDGSRAGLHRDGARLGYDTRRPKL